MITVKDSFFDPTNEDETREEHIRECIFIRDVIKNICKESLAKARKANKCYDKLSKDMLRDINGKLEEGQIDEIRSTHFIYKRDSLNPVKK